MRRSRVVAGVTAGVLCAGAASAIASSPSSPPGAAVPTAEPTQAWKDHLSSTYLEWQKSQPRPKKLERPSAKTLRESARKHRGRHSAVEARRQLAKLAPSMTTGHSLVPEASDVVRPLSATAVQLKGKNGTAGGIAVSNVPIATPAAGAVGRSRVANWKLADLDLESAGNRYRVKRSFLPVSVPKTAGGASRVDDLGAHFAPTDATSAGAVSGETVTYPDVQTDTDLTLRTSSASVKAGWTLRSPAAPTVLKVRLELPDGASAKVVADDGAIAIVDKQDRSLGSISPPSATDSAGAAIDLDTKVVGDTVEITVDHAAGKTAYPAVVDPTFARNWETTTTAVDDFANWPTLKSRTQVPFSFAQNPQYYGQYAGLQISGAQGPATTSTNPNGYTAGDWATFRRYAPGNQATNSPGSVYAPSGRRISNEHAFWYRADLTGIDYSYQATQWYHFVSDPAPTFAFLPYNGGFGALAQKSSINGAAAADGGAQTYPQNTSGWTTQVWIPGTVAPTNPDDARVNRTVDPGRPDNLFVAGLFDRNYYGGNLRPTHAVFLGGYTLYAADDVAPTVDAIPASAWSANPPTSITSTARDNGTGVERLDLLNGSDQSVSSSAAVNNCTTSGDVLCRYTLTSTLSYGQVPDGRSSWNVQATDGGGKTFRRPVALAVDRGAPAVNFGNDLYSKRESAISDGMTRTLEVSATDGTFGGSSGALQSGVQQIQIKLDNSVVKTQNQTSSADSAPLATSWTLDGSTLSLGEHEVLVTVTDRVGRPTTRSFSVRRQDLGEATPMVSATGDSTTAGPDWESNTAAINPFNGNLVVHEIDAMTGTSDGSPDGAIFGIDRWYNSASADDGPLGPAWNFGPGTTTKLTFPNSSRVLLADPSKRTIRFDQSGSAYTSALPEWQLTHTASGWTVTNDDDQRSLKFTEGGELLSAHDLQTGTSVTVGYAGTGSARQLSTATGSNAVQLSLTSSGGSVSGYSGPSSQSGVYQKTSGRLAQVVRSDGSTSTYTYDASTGRLSDIARPGYALHVTYQNGRVATFAETDGGDTSQVTMTYRAPVSGSCSAPSTLQVEANDTALGTTVYCFDAVGGLVDAKYPETPSDPEEDPGPAIDDDGYGAEPTESFCGSGDDPVLDCNEGSLSNPVNAEVLSEGNTEEIITPDPDEPGIPIGTNPPKVASSLVKGGSGWGLADQNRSLFDGTFDAALEDLDITRLRYAIPWDITLRRNHSIRVRLLRANGTLNGKTELFKKYKSTYLAAVDNYIASATDRDIELVLTLDRPSTAAGESQGKNRLPTVKQYTEAVAGIHARWPQVKYIGSFNEMNGSLEATRAYPYTAGRFWRALNRLCNTSAKKCTAIAGDFVDTTSNSPSTGALMPRDYLPDFRRGAGYTRTSPPSVFGLHGYESARSDAGHTRSLTAIRAFANATKCTGCDRQPKIWLTEQGGMYHKHRKPVPDPDAAYADGRFAIQKEPTASTRITRFYYYQLRGDAPTATSNPFDSGLIDAATNQPRPIYTYFKTYANP